MAEIFATLMRARLYAPSMRAHFTLFDAAHHTFAAVLLDALPMLPTRGRNVSTDEVAAALESTFRSKFAALLPTHTLGALKTRCEVRQRNADEGGGVDVGPFHIDAGALPQCSPTRFCFNTPTAQTNAMRVARALASNKPIMLEGVPGCGKSSLVKAFAQLAGYELYRLNLSEETVSKTTAIARSSERAKNDCRKFRTFSAPTFR